MKKNIVIAILSILTISCGGDNNENVGGGNNDKVTAVNDSYQSKEDESYTLPDFLSNDSFGTAGVTVTFDATTSKGGSVTKSGNGYSYTPAKAFVGRDSFTYKICSKKNNDKCSEATVSINVVDQGDPKAENDSYETTKNKEITLNDFLQNDSLVDDTTIDGVESSSTSGTVVLNNDGTIKFIPKADFTGNDTFTYTICDDDTPKSCSTATVTINVKSSGSNSSSFTIPADLSSYYNDVDFTLTGSSLKDALATKTIGSHTKFLSYTPDVWNVLKKADLSATDNTKVLLLYGYNDSDSNTVNDRTRGKNNNGGSSGDWNREHVYPKSLGSPKLGTSGPGSDAHHLRACDVSFNSQRGNKKFATGSGNAGNSSGGWYPGDEWKGDVARMMMYMYLRYGNQCLPKNVAIGTTVSSDANMIQLFLEWNAKDPVSDIEKQRNTVISEAQGNRNPFIDNPYLATVIWGGDIAENRW